MFCSCDFRISNNISIIYLNQLHEFVFATYLTTPSVPDITAITTGRRLLDIRVTKLVKEISAFPATHKCSSVITKDCFSTQSWVNLIQLASTNFNSLSSILILSSHQRMSPKRTLVCNFLRQKVCMHFFFHILCISSILISSN